MSNQQVTFVLGRCLVEIHQDMTDDPIHTFTAFLSYLEENGGDGAVIRPVVAVDGHRVRIRAESEPLALTGAISYLRARFGAMSEGSQPCSLGSATVGRPIELQD